ncbi:MAG TPA: hypothetical protein VGQ39_13890 [Pyrinomonadaceae bacterium]|nr:hypothetical protein [Pyrinomonadaceae bacterium]
MKAFLLIVGILVATAGGVTLYRALYVEPRSAIVITETEVRELPNYKRVVGGALMLVCGAAVALIAAKKLQTKE